MIDDQVIGFDPCLEKFANKEQYEHELKNPTDRRIFVLAAALKSKWFTIDQLYDLTRIDKWFLYKFKNIVDHVEFLEQAGKLNRNVTKSDLLVDEPICMDRNILLKVKRLIKAYKYIIRKKFGKFFVIRVAFLKKN